jgi:hypothetical protein
MSPPTLSVRKVLHTVPLSGRRRFQLEPQRDVDSSVSACARIKRVDSSPDRLPVRNRPFLERVIEALRVRMGKSL